MFKIHTRFLYLKKKWLPHLTITPKFRTNGTFPRKRLVFPSTRDLIWNPKLEVYGFHSVTAQWFRHMHAYIAGSSCVLIQDDWGLLAAPCESQSPSVQTSTRYRLPWWISLSVCVSQYPPPPFPETNFCWIISAGIEGSLLEEGGNILILCHYPRSLAVTMFLWLVIAHVSHASSSLTVCFLSLFSPPENNYCSALLSRHI